jgi:hypothetical protein
MRVKDIRKALDGQSDDQEVMVSIGNPMLSHDFPIEEIFKSSDGKLYIMVFVEENLEFNEDEE